MKNEARKQTKAVEKIRKSIRKAVENGVSTTEVSAAVWGAMAGTADNAAGKSDIDAPATAKAVKMPGGNKQTDVTLKRGVIAPSKKGSGKAILNTKPLKPDSKKPSLKTLSGKRKPPTLTLKRGKNS